MRRPGQAPPRRRVDHRRGTGNGPLFGGFLPSDVTASLLTVSDALRGLRTAMTGNACDSPVIQELERNMLRRVTGNQQSARDLQCSFPGRE
jgi:hypothetical protein